MQTKGTRAKGEKGANSWLDVPERSFPPLNRAVLTVKPINLWIHVSVLCVSLFQGQRNGGCVEYRDILQV